MQTPLQHFDQYYLKREDLNTTGSAKDRALKVQVDNMVRQGIMKAVISSTGNAAISAQHYCQQQGIGLTIFMSPKADPAKVKLLDTRSLLTSLNPIKDAFQFAKKNQAFYLRQSTDPNALIGYQTLGEEIITQLPNVSSIFIAVGSGTTLLGMSQKLPSTVKIFAIQPTDYAPIASHFDPEFTPENTSITDALSVKYIPLKNKVITACSGGYTIPHHEIIEAQKILTLQQVTTSNEGALALAGFFKAKRLHHDTGNFPVIVLTGTKR